MTVDQAIAIAVQHQEAGRLNEAENIYRQILAVDPNHAEAIHLLGCIALQVGNNQMAAELIRRAVALQPNEARFYSNLGEALRRMNQQEEAEATFRKAIQLAPQLAAAYSNLGHVLSAQKRYQEAVGMYSQALALQPGMSPAYSGLGAALVELERYDDALAAFAKALELNAVAPEVYNNIAIVFLKRGDLQQAALHFQKAIQVKPDNADAYSNLGHVLDRLKNYEAAIAACRRAIEINPNHANAYLNLGNILNNARYYDQAILCSRRTIELLPNAAEARNNLAISHHFKTDFDQAMVHYQRAVEIKPEFHNVFSNLGNLYKEMGDPDAAITACRKALAIQPDYAEAHVNLSLPLLLKGDFKQGWEEYEWRWKWPDYPTPLRFTDHPRWDGSALEGRTILLHPEQGLGDSLQFIRYAPLIVKRGGRVIVEVPAPLVPVMRTVEGVAEVFPYGVDLPHFDVHLPLMSLPFIFRTELENIPADVPYLKADPKLTKAWAAKLRSDKNLKVGLVWAGSPQHKNDRFRTIPLAALAPLASVSGVTFYSLQKGPGSEQAADPPAGMKLVDLTDQINDFADTAALISRLDLIISVDTAPVHLAGGMAKPIWMLVPFAPDFRWLLDRTDSPWYPTMRLFRQKVMREWEPVIQKIAEELATWAASNKKKSK